MDIKNIQFEKILNTKSEYFSKILEILKKEEPLNIFEKHHILPKFYFKMNNLDVDNSANNVVKLSPSDHFLIHYYYSKASLPEYSLKFCYAVNRMKKQFQSNTLTEEEQDYFSKLYEENKIILNSKRKGIKRSKETSKKVSEGLQKYFLTHNGPNKNKTFSEEWRKNLSESHKNSEACKENLKNIHNRTSKRLKGKKRPEEVCKKVSEAKKGKSKKFPFDRSKIKTKSRKVLQISTGIIYESCKAAAEANGISYKAFNNGINKKIEKYKDFIFISNSKQKILQKSTNKIFNSYSELAAFLNTSSGSIRIGIKKNLPKYEDFILIDD